MELPGAGYLYALATISVTFVGFSALLLVFRQTAGGATTRYDSYFLLAFMQVGFIVAGGSMLPPLLALFGLAEVVVWRVSSVVAAVKQVGPTGEVSLAVSDDDRLGDPAMVVLLDAADKVLDRRTTSIGETS